MLRLTVLLLLATCAICHPSNLFFRRQVERIVGGSRAEEGQFKHQVALELTKSKRHQCGGTIIDKNTILTAAHCVFQLSASDFTVITGSTKLDAGGDKYKVERIIQHPDYDIKTKQNDLAIIKTAEHIRWTANVQPIPLATSELEAGEEVVLTGWGFTSWPSSTTPNDLMFIKLKAISNTDCALRMIWYNTITENQVCTLTRRGEGACGGDSGGPLISSPYYQPRLAGVVSWGIPCGAGSPDIYASVFSYKDWIYEQMDNLENAGYHNGVDSTNVTLAQKQSRIVGGKDVTDGEYPYQVSIRNRGVHDCGGAIIDEYWILTAAHCLTSRLPSKMSVVVGTIYLDHGGEEYNVSKIIPHPQFSKITLRDDIGLLKVDRPFVFGAKVQPIKLPTHDVDSGVKLMLTGWGQLDVEDEMPNKLQKLELESISHFRCILSHGALKIWLTNVCTFTKAGEGACYGDSGSPLVHDGHIMGIISWSKPCATGRPDVSTRVYYYLFWIMDNKH